MVRIRQTFECSDCEKSYSSELDRKLHFKASHGGKDMGAAKDVHYCFVYKKGLKQNFG